MTKAKKEAPRLRWHDKGELIDAALWTKTIATAGDLLRNLWFATYWRRGDAWLGVRSPDEYRAEAADEARRLLDLVALQGIRIADIGIVLDTAWTIGEFREESAHIRAEACKLLDDIDTGRANHEP